MGWNPCFEKRRRWEMQEAWWRQILFCGYLYVWSMHIFFYFLIYTHMSHMVCIDQCLYNRFKAQLKYQGETISTEVQISIQASLGMAQRKFNTFPWLLLPVNKGQVWSFQTKKLANLLQNPTMKGSQIDFPIWILKSFGWPGNFSVLLDTVSFICLWKWCNLQSSYEASTPICGGNDPIWPKKNELVETTT